MTNQNPNYNIRERPVWSARGLPKEPTDFIKRMLERAAPLLAEDFKGLTTDGQIVSGLFSIAKTGASTEKIRIAVEAFFVSLSPENRSNCEFPLDSKEWHRWSNIHPFLMRHKCAWMGGSQASETWPWVFSGKASAPAGSTRSATP